MKMLLLFAASLFWALPALAVVNPQENVIGPYFDESADLDCLEGVGMNTQLPVYIILTRPTFGELFGFEVGLDYGSSLVLVGQEFHNDQALNVGSGNDFVVGFGMPTYTREATVLMTLTMLYLGSVDSPTYFALRGTQPSSVDPDYPAVLMADGELMATALHSQYRPYPYLINGQCDFADEDRSWDGVKSLYRR